jgi:surfactin synthase thioesterase subunit
MMRLVVLPHAGGAGHAYAPLQQALARQAGGSAIEVVLCDLPGHGKRAREPMLGSLDDVLRDLVCTAAPRDERPWAIFGHSMGAILAHALIHELQARGRRLPEMLFVSGTVSPSTRSRRVISHLPKEAFWQEIRNYGGMPDEILEVADFRDFFEGILRNDFAVLEGSPALAPRPVPVPIIAFHGLSEMTETQAMSWEWETSHSLDTYGFPGHHFFVFEHVEAVAEVVARALMPPGSSVVARYG